MIIVLLIFFSNISIQISYAKGDVENNIENDKLEDDFSEHLNDILNDINTDEIDDYIVNDYNLDFFSSFNFKELVIKILNGEYFSEYDSLLDAVKKSFRDGFHSLAKIFLLFFILVILFEVFKVFCIDKYIELKSSVNLIFSLVIIVLLLQIFKNLSVDISSSIEKIFSFSKIIFPILLNLILLSGASGTYSVYSSLSLFFLNTGSYIFLYILFPISVSIFILTIFGSFFSNKQFSRILDIFKSMFKYIIIIYFSIFGLFSSVNIIVSGVKDGVGLRLTKYAIKNYIPIIGGYVSQGFDFVHSCSVVIKNAFGICSIIVLFFAIFKPILSYLIYIFLFKILSVFIALVGNMHYSDLFNNVSKTLSYFLIVLVGLFFIFFILIYLLILSVSVV